MLNKTFSMLIALLACMSVAGQSVSEIKSGKDYYWGEGIGRSSKMAEDEALSSLIRMISVRVSSGNFLKSEQRTVNGESTYSERAENILRSYSSATLNNTERMEWEERDGMHVLCYVKRTEVRKIFASREQKIKDFVQTAIGAESRLQMADALKYYYWALLLLQSHPDGSTLALAVDGREENLSLFLPRRIDRVLGGLECRVTGKRTEPNLTFYNLVFSYQGKPVGNLEYRVHNGRLWLPVTGAKDGIGVAELVGDDEQAHKEIRLRVEYEFGDEWKTDKDVNDVLPYVDPVPFKAASMVVPIRRVDEFQAEVQVATPEADMPPLPGDVETYRSLLERVQQAIDSRDYEAAQPCFTPEGYDVYQKLVHNGQAVICGQPNYRFVPCEGGFMARSLPMRFTFSNRRSFVEQVVFQVDTAAHKISNLTFALSDHMVRSILEHEQWNERSRLAIIDFIETYQTAYALKRLDYLQSVFSDDALIIVGKVLAPATHLEGQYIPPRVRQNRLSKETYMRNLKACFAAQEYINLKFADINIVRAGKGGEIYGIQMQQDYFSTTYGDTGYLFLHVDLNDPDRPVIHVRTWQPEKDPVLGAYNMGNLGL